MTKKEIGEVLCAVRKNSGKTREELGELLGKTAKTIGHWETGYAQPDANMLFLLCSVCGTDVNTAFGFSPSSSQVTPTEQQLLTDYRNLNEDGQEYIQKQMEFASSQPEYKKCNPPESVDKTA